MKQQYKVYTVRGTNAETGEVVETSLLRTSAARAINAMRSQMAPYDKGFVFEVVQVTSVEDAYKEALHALICSTVDAGSALSLTKSQFKRVSYLDSVSARISWLRTLAWYAKKETK